MFPPRKKSAAVKKNMQILHGLLQTQQTDASGSTPSLEEECALLEAAISAAKSRVIVKRPIKAALLGEDAASKTLLRPSHCVCGSVNRWDVYQT